MSFLKKLKLFWWNHWVKIVVVAWVVFICWIPMAALGSIDSYQRSYMVAWLSTMGLQATISAVIFFYEPPFYGVFFCVHKACRFPLSKSLY